MMVCGHKNHWSLLSDVIYERTPLNFIFLKQWPFNLEVKKYSSPFSQTF